MEKVRLFNDDLTETYNEFGKNFDIRMSEFVQALVDEAVSCNICLRDLSYILKGSVEDVILYQLAWGLYDGSKSKPVHSGEDEEV